MLARALIAARSSKLAMPVRCPLPAPHIFVDRWLVFCRLWTFGTRLPSLRAPWKVDGIKFGLRHRWQLRLLP